MNLLDAAVEHGVKKFVFSSTCATFGIPDRVPIDSSFPQVPINPYGESSFYLKRCCDGTMRSTVSSMSRCVTSMRPARPKNMGKIIASRPI